MAVGSGVVVIKLGIWLMGSVKLLGPVVPKLLTAVTIIMVFPPAFGTPVSKQLELNVAHEGSPVALQVGAGFPVTTI